MQVGIDSFAAAFDDSSRAVSPSDHCVSWSTKLHTPIKSAWTPLASVNTIAGSFLIPLLPSSSRQPRHKRSASA